MVQVTLAEKEEVCVSIKKIIKSNGIFSDPDFFEWSCIYQERGPQKEMLRHGLVPF